MITHFSSLITTPVNINCSKKRDYFFVSVVSFMLFCPHDTVWNMRRGYVCLDARSIAITPKSKQQLFLAGKSWVTDLTSTEQQSAESLLPEPTSSTAYWGGPYMDVSSSCEGHNFHTTLNGIYSDTHVILDCTEIQCQTPSSLLFQNKVFST